MKNILSIIGLAIFSVVIGLTVLPAVAAITSVVGLFEAGDYDEAAGMLADNSDGARGGEQALWRARLATDPAVAISLLAAHLSDRQLPAQVRIRLALELANIQAGLGHHGAVLTVLMPLINTDEASLPGVVYLRAGLSLRATGRLQQAREMLASVRPGDPEFVLARYYLGDIGLEEKDATLALRYFEAAAKAADKSGQARLAAGLWRAYMAHDQADKAQDLASKLSKSDPGSLALLEIGRLRQMEADERRARAAATPQNDETVAPVRDLTGRYALQIGAFSDRGLALEIVERYSNQLPNLRIDKVRDARGQFLYKVRAGDFVNPAMARSEAKRWARRLDIDVIVADLSAQGE